MITRAGRKGKIVVVLRGYPTGMASEEGAHLSATKAQMAQAHGAIGVITVATNASAKVRPGNGRCNMLSIPITHGWVRTAKPMRRPPASALPDR
jgi:hypothetical protein